MKTVLYVLPFFLPVLARVLQRSIPYKDVTLYTIVNTASPQQTTIVSALVDPEWPGMMSAQGEDDKPEDPVPFWGTVTISQAVVYDPTATALSTIAVPTQAIGGEFGAGPSGVSGTQILPYTGPTPSGATALPTQFVAFKCKYNVTAGTGQCIDEVHSVNTNGSTTVFTTTYGGSLVATMTALGDLPASETTTSGSSSSASSTASASSSSSNGAERMGRPLIATVSIAIAFMVFST